MILITSRESLRDIAASSRRSPEVMRATQVLNAGIRTAMCSSVAQRRHRSGKEP